MREAFGELCVGCKVGRVINPSILCRHSRTLKPPHSRMSELDQTRCTLLSSLLGLRGGARELPFMLGAEHLTHPFHPCSILGLGKHDSVVVGGD